jgi:alpha-L-rhamnosidase
VQISQLFVESRINPLGIDVERPAFSWGFQSSKERSQLQSAYRVLVSRNAESLSEGIGDVWDSGKVASRRNVHVLYDGPALHSRERYYWKAQIWDKNDHMTESSIAWWEMGLLHESDWSARWIAETKEIDPKDKKAPPLFRHEFNVEKAVANARVYICGLGHYELRINGSKIGDSVLDPGWTNFNKTVLYNVYDVTDELKTSSNTIGVMLGNGFFNVTGGRYTKFKDSFGIPRYLVQLEVEYTDGTTATIVSNNEWRMSSGPITFTCIYGGEDYDARLEQQGWDSPGFTPDPQWINAVEVEAPKGKLKSQKNPPLKIMKTFQPVDIKEPAPGVYVIDFGQNFSGWVSISAQGTEGSVITMTPAELLKEDGTANQKHTGSPYKLNYTG